MERKLSSIWHDMITNTSVPSRFTFIHNCITVSNFKENKIDLSVKSNFSGDFDSRGHIYAAHDDPETRFQATNVQIDPTVLEDVKATVKELGIASSTKDSGDKTIYDTEHHIQNQYPSLPFRSSNLTELLELGEVETYSDDSTIDLIDQITITGVEHTVAVKAGDLFFCLAEQEHSMKTAITKAFSLGASGAVCKVIEKDLLGEWPKKALVIEVDDVYKVMGRIADHFYERPSRRMKVVGVTGTSGKTTTSWLIRGILEEMDQLVGLIGTIEYALAELPVKEDGTFWNPCESDHTKDRACTSPFHFTPYPSSKYFVPLSTPDALRIQQVIASFADRGGTTCILECSTTGLKEGRCEAVDFDVVINTNYYQDSYHYKMSEKALEANLGLYRTLTDPQRQRAIINVDDPFSEHFVTAANKVPILTYGMLERDADIYVDKLETSIFETSVVINTPLNTRLKIATALVGKINVYNVLGAVGVAMCEGASLKRIVTGIEAVEIIPGRCELIDEGQDFSVVVDYAHNPPRLSMLLDTLRECKPSRILTVLGCGGDQDRNKRAYMGEVSHYKSDVLILTNDSPRSEAPNDIIEDIVAGWPDDILMRHSWFLFPWYQDIGRLPVWYTDQALWAQSVVRRYIIEDRYLAIRNAIYSAQTNDLVLIAGRGHEDFQEWDQSAVYGNTTNKMNENPRIPARLIKGWFDDRVECRNALSKLHELQRLLPGLDRSTMPWMWPGIQRSHPLEEWDDEGLASLTNT